MVVLLRFFIIHYGDKFFMGRNYEEVNSGNNGDNIYFY
ncbi:hypothetical protein O185_02620 [Photorhabdus temperata J3]|uniref:Uncharacterized protein n=1 Tax=Photorhabdus temperata J3 TaxID=1389415 RepID=U7R463_PHOTE|nr:hypothetical protein O185_02620 [Photorhabdus temperata J3]